MLGIKLKRNKTIRITSIIITICLISVINVLFFWEISKQSITKYKNRLETQNELSTDLVREIYEGISVLWLNLSDKGDTEPKVQQFIDISGISSDLQRQVTAQFNSVYQEILADFHTNRENIDYYAKSGECEQWNSENDLSVFAKSSYKYGESTLEYSYRNLWVMKFDDSGKLEVNVIKSDDTMPKNIQKELINLSKENAHIGRVLDYDYLNHINRKVHGEGLLGNEVVKIKNLTIVYGIPKDSSFYITEKSTFSEKNLFRVMQIGAIPSFLISVICIFVLAFVMTNPKIWKDLPLQKKRKQYLLEISVVGLLLSGLFYNTYCFGIFQVQNNKLNDLWDYIDKYHLYFSDNDFTELILYGMIIGICYIVFSHMYILFAAICPVFSMGVNSYVKQYSYTYKRIPYIKADIEHIKKNIETFDLKSKGSGMILKLVFIHTLIIVAMSCFGVGGILVAFGYTAIVFYIINYYYKELAQDYTNLIEITNYIAEGNFDIEMKKKLGIFEQAKNGLERIQSGFKKAVEEEVKSQRMKTELITNVSHDLKTPLTAITTYIELLKNEDLTEEEQKIYIETLEQKSIRMKILIEDLFEVSKTSSNDIVLDLMQVDLVNLMKQVCIEHCEAYEEMGLKLCWNVPEEKVELMLDNQRTYRIFENLFVNIEKYAMPNSRVYVDVMQSEECVVVTIKNMSAEELNVEPEELTERFVRGDASRNTEGSGLGLAIAKNLIELQNGTLEIAVDGDLFKTIIRWKK